VAESISGLGQVSFLEVPTAGRRYDLLVILTELGGDDPTAGAR